MPNINNVPIDNIIMILFALNNEQNLNKSKEPISALMKNTI